MNLIEDAANYWANDNREFENQNPSIAKRVLRTINPLTSFGNAMGDMHIRAGNGDKTGMAMAAASAVPAFGAMKLISTPGVGAVKAGVSSAPDLASLIKALISGGVVGAASDAYGNERN